MKGGVRLTLTDEEFAQVMERFRQDTQLPIPSQKRGICATDTLSAILWYTDEIRPLLWEIVKNGIDSDCDTNFQSLSTRDLVLCWLKMTGARVATILQKSFYDRKVVFRDVLQKLTPPVTDANSLSEWLSQNQSKDQKTIAHIQDMFRNAYTLPSTITWMTRQPSASPEELSITNVEGAAVGEVCSMIYHTYRLRLLAEQGKQGFNQSELESILKKTSFGAETDIMPSLINSSFQLLGVDTEYECGPTLPPFATPLAIYLVVDSKSSVPESSHAVGLCKINGHWQFLDNNMGYSLPLREEYDTDDTVVNNPLSVGLIYKKDTRDLKITLTTKKTGISYVGTTQTPQSLSIGGLREWPEISRFYVYKKSVDPAILSQMLGYGLTEEEAKPALLATNSNIDAAFEWLQVNNPLALGPPEGVDRNAYTQILRNHRFDKKDIVQALQATNNDVDAAIKQLEEKFVRDIYSGGGRKKTYPIQIMKQRRNTYRRHRKQKGGVQLTFRIPVIQQRFNDNAIAIPSQKQAICVTDAFQACLWYTDEIRERLWSGFNENEQGNVIVNTDAIDAQLPEFRNRAIQAIQQNREYAWDTAPDIQELKRQIVTNWMNTTGARVGGILQGNAPSGQTESSFFTPARTILARVASEGPQNCANGLCPVGTACAKWYHLYFHLREATNGSREAINVAREPAIQAIQQLVSKEDMWGSPSAIVDMTREIFQVAGLNNYDVGESIPSGATLLAMYIGTKKKYTQPYTECYVENGRNIKTERAQGDFDLNTGHYTAIVKINDRWFYFDNEVGVAEPLLTEGQNPARLTDADPFVVQYTRKTDGVYELVRKGLQQITNEQKTRPAPAPAQQQQIIRCRGQQRDGSIPYVYSEINYGIGQPGPPAYGRIYVYKTADTAPAPTSTSTPAPTSTSTPAPVITTVQPPAPVARGTITRQSDNTSIAVNVTPLPNNQYELRVQGVPTLLVSRIQGGGNSSYSLTFGGETFPIAMEEAPEPGDEEDMTDSIPTQPGNDYSNQYPPETGDEEDIETGNDYWNMTSESPSEPPTGPPNAPEGMITERIRFEGQDVYAFTEATPRISFTTTLNGSSTQINLGGITFLDGRRGILWSPYPGQTPNILLFDAQDSSIPGMVYFPNASIRGEEVIAVPIERRFFVIFRSNGVSMFATRTDVGESLMLDDDRSYIVFLSETQDETRRQEEARQYSETVAEALRQENRAAAEELEARRQASALADQEREIRLNESHEVMSYINYINKKLNDREIYNALQAMEKFERILLERPNIVNDNFLRFQLQELRNRIQDVSEVQARIQRAQPRRYGGKRKTYRKGKGRAKKTRKH